MSMMRKITKQILILSLCCIYVAPCFAQNGEAECNMLYDRIVVGSKEFQARFPMAKAAPNNYIARTAKIQKANCAEAQANETIRDIVAHMNATSGKIGLILPLTGTLSTYGQAILSGINAQFQIRRLDFQRMVVVKDNGSDSTRDERLYADLILEHQIQAVIGGFQSAAAASLSYWSEKLAVPTILLSSPPTSQAKKKYAFYVFPKLSSLLDTLALHTKQKKYTRIALLYPHNQTAQMSADLAKTLFETRGVKIVEEATYTQSDYTSMEASARKIFHSEDSLRSEEYRDLVAKQKLIAEKNGVAFNAKMVVLPPQINFDAILIPDNFKQVRHLIQIFKYLGVKQLPLMGTLEWRSEGLLKPYDRFLNGSYFADFIGNYQDIPPALMPPASSNYIADMNTLESLDFRIIGWRAADVILANTVTMKKRHALANAIAEWQEPPKPYFGAGRAFDAEHNSRWPTFLFSIFNEKLQLELTPTISQNTSKTK